MTEKQEKLTSALVKNYNKLLTKYRAMYGENTALLYQVGSFLEIYDSDPKSMYAETLCNLLNIICTRKNKAITTISQSNPRFAGFTIIAKEKYLRVLQASGWTTVLVEQTTPPPKPKREVTEIISPGTYIDGNLSTQSNFIFSVYVERLKQYQSDVHLNYVGISAIDVSTGRIYVYEASDTLSDSNFAAQETYRFIHSYNSSPKEVIINGNFDDEFLAMCEIKNPYLNQWHNSFIEKIAYQNKIFEKYYGKSLLTPIENIGLEQYNHARISLCILFQYVYEHNPRLLERIDKPVYWHSEEHLLLSHDAYQQLNLYDNSSEYNSVFDVLNLTSTPMGARLLRDRLLHPIASIDRLNKRYDQIDHYRKDKESTNRLSQLRSIVDLERFHRKLVLGKLHPIEFVKLMQSYEIIQTVSKEDNPSMFSLLQTKLTKYEKLFCFTEMSKCKLDQMQCNFFQPGIYPEIDALVQEKQNNESKLNTLRKEMIQSLLTVDKKLAHSDDLVKLIRNDKEGYHLTMTKLRWNKIKDLFQLEPRTMSSYVKLSSKDIRNINANLDEIAKEMSEKLLSCYQEFCSKVDSKDLRLIHDYVALLDLNLTIAKGANIYGYNRPTLIDHSNSYVNAKQIRHPLIERIHSTETYVPNDISLGQDESGMIITALNAAGKSSLLRAVGVNVTLAQAGFFVACNAMELSLFRSILTRIEGNDNMLQGRSSFMVEMMELKSILERSTINSLVLADELSKGTENKSGIAILSATIIELMNRSVPFMFTTHLHKIKEIGDVMELSGLGFYYLQMDITDSEIKINRTLMRGFCPSHYGLEVAKLILNNDDFMRRAFRIRNEIMDQHQNIVSCKQSRYNKDVFMDKCQWSDCQETKQLHTHHIREQHEANEHNLNDGYIQKNQVSNLMVLCEKHHKLIHTND